MIDFIDKEKAVSLLEKLTSSIKEAKLNKKAIRLSTRSERNMMYDVAKKENVRIVIQKENGFWLCFVQN